MVIQKSPKSFSKVVQKVGRSVGPPPISTSIQAPLFLFACHRLETKTRRDEIKTQEKQSMRVSSFIRHAFEFNASTTMH